ncbi:hypothetical protein KSS87_007657, partial [Heliosperma pusillum]
MDNIREQSRQRAPMYSDDELMTLLQELHLPSVYSYYTRWIYTPV